MQGIAECRPPPVVPEEDKVPLVVEGDHPPALELRVVWKQSCKHASHRVAQASGQVVQNNLRDVTSWPAMTLHRENAGICIHHKHDGV